MASKIKRVAAPSHKEPPWIEEHKWDWKVPVDADDKDNKLKGGITLNHRHGGPGVPHTCHISVLSAKLTVNQTADLARVLLQVVEQATPFGVLDGFE